MYTVEAGGAIPHGIYRRIKLNGEEVNELVPTSEELKKCSGVAEDDGPTVHCTGHEAGESCPFGYVVKANDGKARDRSPCNGRSMCDGAPLDSHLRHHLRQWQLIR